MSNVIASITAPALVAMASFGAPGFAAPTTAGVVPPSYEERVHVLGPFSSEQAANDAARDWEHRGYQTRVCPYPPQSWYVIVWRREPLPRFGPRR
jgi:hypothetical protein